MPASIRSAMARPSGVISTRTLRRSPGLDVRRIQPRRSSRSRLAVMVADATSTRSLIWVGVSGPAAPSSTASTVPTGWPMSKLASIRRSSSSRAAVPARTSEAKASVLLASPPGYSASKSGSTLTTPSTAGEGRLPLPGVRRYRTGNSEDFDLRRPGHPGPGHPRLQIRVASELARVFRRREVMRDEHVVRVAVQLPGALSGAAVPNPQRLELVVDLPPGSVVIDLVPDDQSCAHAPVSPQEPKQCCFSTGA